MAQVIKRNGSKQAFNEEKIKRSIRRAAIDAGLSVQIIGTDLEKIAEKVIRKFKEGNEVTSKVIKEEILMKLKELQVMVNANS